MSDTPMDATPRTLDVALADIRSWRARYESMERALRAELSEARTDAYRYRAERDAMQAVERYDAAEAAERIIGEWVQLECSVHLNSADVDFLRLRLTAALTAAAERERVLREALLNLCSAVDVRLMAETEYQNAVGLGRPYSVRSRLGDKAAEAITAEMVALSAAKRAALEATS